MKALYNLAISIMLLSLLSACKVSAPEGLQPISNLDADKYLGTWYEIARMDHSFERDLENVTATYSMRDDGGIKVVNKGFNIKDKEWEDATGKAYFTEGPTVGQLKVSFFGPFFGGYNIIDLDANYQTALVVGHDRDTVWFLARSPELDESVKNRLLRTAEAAGIDTSALYWVDQSANFEAM